MCKSLAGIRLYEALGPSNEINVAVPFYGRRQIVKGSVYSYYEFESKDQIDSKKWQEMKNQPDRHGLRNCMMAKILNHSPKCPI